MAVTVVKLWSVYFFPVDHIQDCTCIRDSFTLLSSNFLFFVLLVLLVFVLLVFVLVVFVLVIYATARRRAVHATAAVEEETVDHTSSEMVLSANRQT